MDLNAIPWQVRSGDIRHVQNQVMRYLKPFRILPRPGEVYDARLFHQRLGHTELSLIGYGGALSIDAGRLGGFAILQVPLLGSYNCGGLEIAEGGAHLIPPAMPIVMDWQAGLILLVVRFDRLAAEQAGLGRALPAGQGRRIGLEAGAGAALGRALTFVLAECAARPEGVREAALLEQLLLSRLAACLAPGRQRETPDLLRQAEDWLLERLTQSGVRLADLAQGCGAPASTVSHLFTREHGLGPLAWLRERRLDAARVRLQEGEPVTPVAMALGFSHMGRLSAAYRRRFGETPGQTAKVRR